MPRVAASSAYGASIRAVRLPSVPSAKLFQPTIPSRSSPSNARPQERSTGHSRSRMVARTRTVNASRACARRCACTSRRSRSYSMLPAAVMPSALQWRIAATSAARRSSAGGSGSRGFTSCHAACSRSSPVGAPDASRTTSPPAGQGSPAKSASTGSFTTHACWSIRYATQGTAPAPRSQSFVGRSPPQPASCQPKARSQRPGPRRRAASAIACSNSARERTPERSSCASVCAPSERCRCPSIRPGRTTAPGGSATVGRSGRPASRRPCAPPAPAPTPVAGSTATTRPSATSIAPAHGHAGSAVQIRAPAIRKRGGSGSAVRGSSTGGLS